MTETAHESETTPQFTPYAGSDGAALLAGEHLDSMPTPQEHAIAAEQEDAEKQQARVDDHGTPFDPEQHVDGPLTKSGHWRKKPGRKAGGGSSGSSLNTSGSEKGSGQNSGQVDQGAYVSAVATVDSVGMVAQMLGGEDYSYKVVMAEDKKTVLLNERENGIEAFTKLYEAQGVKDIPPGMAVVIWGMMYLTPRLSQDKRAKNKFKAAWYWILSKLGRKSKPKKADKSDDEKGH